MSCYLMYSAESGWENKLLRKIEQSCYTCSLSGNLISMSYVCLNTFGTIIFRGDRKSVV